MRVAEMLHSVVLSTSIYDARQPFECVACNVMPTFAQPLFASFAAKNLCKEGGAMGNAQGPPVAKRDHKDTLFRDLFKDPEHALSLYNALNGTVYDNPDDLEVTTLEDVIYINMKNDVSFIISNEMNLWEHQSTFNPNMPMRFLEYACRLYEKYMAGSGYYGQSRKLQMLPRPHCICFYNGTEEQPERMMMKLSDAFGGEGDIEVRVLMLNVNYGKNQALLDACKPLQEYAWLVEKVRQNQKITNNIEAAVDAAVDEMPDSFELKTFLVANRAEVKIMFLTQYDEKKTLAMEREEGREEGKAEALKAALLVLKAQGKTDEEIAEFEKHMAELAVNG